MSDIVDIANQTADESLARALANRVQKAATISPIDCEECGNPIEPKRREIIAGTKHCAECAAYFEERKRFTNGG